MLARLVLVGEVKGDGGLLDLPEDASKGLRVGELNARVRGAGEEVGIGSVQY